MKPEGVVVFHAASRNLYKVTIEKDEVPPDFVATVRAMRGDPDGEA